MITLRSSKERHHDRRRKHEEWSTFDPDDQADLLGAGFGALEQIDEDRLPPGAGIPRQVHQAGELVTYVREGALAYEDSMGRTGLIHTGEFHRMTVGPGLRHSETNASRTEWVHVFQIWLRPAVRGLEPNREQKRLFDFSVRVTVKRPQDIPAVSAEGPASAPARPASGPTAAATPKKA